MANYRNEFEFRSGLLNALGVEHSEADAKNEERWRAKMLDGLEVEYNQNDVNQFDLFRAKLVEGVEAKAEGGGGGSWQTVFEGIVETVDDDGDIIGIIENLTLTGDSIKATLNGTEYILPKTEHGYGAENESGIDFSTYPLFIALAEGVDSCTLWTPTAGTYTLKIEEQSGGGSSDLSTAEVTFICSSEPEINFAFINVQNDGIYSLLNITESTQTVTVPLYKNKLSCGISQFYMSITSTSGSITGTQMAGYIISGDCTINYTLPN